MCKYAFVKRGIPFLRKKMRNIPFTVIDIYLSGGHIVLVTRSHAQHQQQFLHKRSVSRKSSEREHA